MFEDEKHNIWHLDRIKPFFSLLVCNVCTCWTRLKIPASSAPGVKGWKWRSWGIYPRLYIWPFVLNPCLRVFFNLKHRYESLEVYRGSQSAHGGSLSFGWFFFPLFGPCCMCSAHSAENDWCLEARPPRCLSTSQLREARRYKTDGGQKSAKLVSLDLSAQSRAGRMRISRRVQTFAPKDIRTSVAEIALRCQAVFVCNIRWHCCRVKLSMSSWLFD